MSAQVWYLSYYVYENAHLWYKIKLWIGVCSFETTDGFMLLSNKFRQIWCLPHKNGKKRDGDEIVNLFGRTKK